MKCPLILIVVYTEFKPKFIDVVFECKFDCNILFFEMAIVGCFAILLVSAIESSTKIDNKNTEAIPIESCVCVQIVLHSAQY